MMKPTDELEGLVLSVIEYKEKDGIVKLLTKDKVVSVLAKGIQKSSSKNRRLCLAFTKVRLYVEYKENGLSLLYHGEVVASYHHIMDSLVSSSVCFCLAQILEKSTITKDLYDVFDQCLEAYHKNLEKAHTLACFVLREILIQEGIAPFVDGCVLCGRMDHLEALSDMDGGFLCSTCNHGKILTRSKNELIQIRSLFRVKKEQLDLFCSMYSMDVVDVVYWASWYEKYMHLSIASLSFLSSVQALK